MSTRVMYKAALTDLHGGDVLVWMSANAEVLHVEMQRRTPTLWFINDPQQSQVARRFLTIWTGHEFNVDGLVHVGSAVGEHLVLHIFEVQA